MVLEEYQGNKVEGEVFVRETADTSSEVVHHDIEAQDAQKIDAFLGQLDDLRIEMERLKSPITKAEHDELQQVMSSLENNFLSLVSYFKNSEQLEEFTNTIVRYISDETWNFYVEDRYREYQACEILEDVLIAFLTHEQTQIVCSVQTIDHVFAQLVQYHIGEMHRIDDYYSKMDGEGLHEEGYTSDSHWDLGYDFGEIDALDYDNNEDDIVRMNILIRDIAKLGSQQTIDTLFDLVHKYGGRVTRFVGQACSTIDGSYSEHLILKHINKTENKKSFRKNLERILFRIELGEIGVDENGVEYWGKKYDLGELNGTDNVARRITGYGDVGIFNTQTKEFRGMFRPVSPGETLKDHDVDEPIYADVRQLILSDIFLNVAKEGGIDRSKQEAILTQFKDGYYAKLIDNFHIELGVYLNNLTLREQAWFLLFLGTASVEDQKRAKEVVREFGEDGLRTFISLEVDPQSSGDIFRISEGSIRAETKRRIFGKYSEILESSEKVREYLLKNFESQNISSEKIEAIIFNILKRGRDTLAKFSIKLQDTKDTKEIERNILHELQKIKANTILFANILRQLPREEVSNLDLKEIPVIEKIQDISGRELTQREDLLEKIKAIIRIQFPSGDDVEFEKEVTNNDDIRLTVSLADGEVLSFFAKKKIGDKLEYVDWFISNPDTEIKGLGEATVKLGFQADAGKGYSYYAVAKPHVKSFPISIESLGFSAFAGSTEDGEYKHHYVRMCRIPEDGSLVAKSMDVNRKEDFKKRIYELCTQKNETQHLIFDGSSFEVCRIEFTPGLSAVDDITKNDSDGWLMSEIERQFKKGKVLSSFISHSNARDNVVYYAVFEKDVDIEKRQQIYQQLGHAA
ncbi:MAG: hypothetical protein HYV41_00405 [Candidatus Magasanikbacteria bacterium]|nr:hypothetical protein [Candidatus Magasanikbacteria bacterium]